MESKWCVGRGVETAMSKVLDQTAEEREGIMGPGRFGGAHDQRRTASVADIR